MTEINRETRVLITGARIWPVTMVYMVHAALDAEHQRIGPYGRMTVVHGACPTGADWFAERWCRAKGYGTGGAYVHAERHPARWEDCDEKCSHVPQTRRGENYCPAAGPRRNVEMVDLGAHICHAFIVDGVDPNGKAYSRGTRNCAALARERGIPVIQHVIHFDDIPWVDRVVMRP